MISTELLSVGTDAVPLKRYRLPGIEREGIAQLSLLETALWPIQGGKLPSNKFETQYGFMTDAAQDLSRGERVTIRLPAIGRIEAHVIWATDDRAGFQFERILRYEDFVAMID